VTPSGGGVGYYKQSMKVKTYVLLLIILFFSIKPVINLFSPGQLMNYSFNRFHLVNTYGAFGTVGKERYEIILEGTADTLVTDSTHWKEYDFKCKPDDLNEAPCIITPYHLRLDWQMWFAAMQNINQNEWLVHLCGKLLSGNPGPLDLLGKNPFPESPPKYIRAKLYEYRFSTSDEEGWWQREELDNYFGKLSLDNPGFVDFLNSRGWYERLNP